MSMNKSLKSYNNGFLLVSTNISVQVSSDCLFKFIFTVKMLKIHRMEIVCIGSKMDLIFHNNCIVPYGGKCLDNLLILPQAIPWNSEINSVDIYILWISKIFQVCRNT